MVWVFLTITLGALAFAIRIVSEHMRDTQRLQDQVGIIKAEQDNVEGQVESQRASADDAKAQCDNIKAEIGKQEAALRDLRAQIETQKGEMERRGKFRIG